MDFSMNQFCFNLSLARCRQLCLLFPNFKWIRTFPAKLSALTVMCVCVSVSPLSQSIFPPIFPHSHTHTDTESTHTGQRQADFIYRHYMYPTDMFLALHRFQHRHGYAEKQTHTPDTHTHRRTRTHTRTLNFQFRLPRQAPRLPPRAFPTLFFL